MLAFVSYLLILVSFVFLLFCCLDAPEITHISTPQTLNRGEMLTLNCTADGNPAPTITWTRLSNGNIVRMPLTVIGKEYEGGYRRTASNRIGTVIKDTSVTVNRMYLYLFLRNVSRNEINKYSLERMTNLPYFPLLNGALLPLGEFVTFVKFATCEGDPLVLSFALTWLLAKLANCHICRIHHIRQIYHIRKIRHIRRLQRRPSCLVICIDSLVAHDSKLAKLSKWPTSLCITLFAILIIAPNSLLRGFLDMNGFILVKSSTVI